jgi:hypothetical protein
MSLYISYYDFLKKSSLIADEVIRYFKTLHRMKFCYKLSIIEKFKARSILFELEIERHSISISSSNKKKKLKKIITI